MKTRYDLEMIVRRLVHGMGYRYRLHAHDLPGNPDLVFRPRKRVIFVHGGGWTRAWAGTKRMAKQPRRIPPFNPLDKTNLGESVAESLLVEIYSPLWNQKIDGLGNHDPGKGRYNQQRSPWDIIHPGRSWAYKLQPPSNDEHVVREGAAAYITRTKTKIMAQQEDALDGE
jgi:hypothetical protein